jgi:hypothetical protein
MIGRGIGKRNCRIIPLPIIPLPNMGLASLSECRMFRGAPMAPVNEAATFTPCCGPESGLPRSGRDVYDRAYARRIAPSRVGYDDMNARLIHGRTCTGCSDSLMGCTQDEQD